MRKLWIILAVLLIIVGIGLYVSQTPKKDYRRQIDSLNVELQEVRLHRDTLIQLVDSSKTIVKYIDRWYEKESIIIDNQSTTDDMLFFSDYISKYNK